MIGDKIICLLCQRTKTNFNTEYILSIPLTKPSHYLSHAAAARYNTSVSEGMKQFFAVETLPSNEKLHCS